MSVRDIEILARTIYGEARGEYNRLDGGLSSLIAIGNVVQNRVAQKSWFGSTISEVCLKPWQFSCWNPGDPNSTVLSGIIADRHFDICKRVAEGIINLEWPDLTKGCDHYHALSLTKLPLWAVKNKPRVKIGGHLFYKLS